MPPQPTDVPTYVQTLGGQRMVARQPNPPGAPSSVITAAADPLGLTANAPPTVQEQPVHTLSGREQGLSVPVSGGVPQPGPNERLAGAPFIPMGSFLRHAGQGINMIPRAVEAAPRTVTAGGGLSAATLGSAEANPKANPEKDAIVAQLIATDAVLQTLQRQIDQERAIANAPAGNGPGQQVQSNRVRASERVTDLTKQYNDRLSRLTQGNLPFDQAHPWLAQNRALLGVGAPIVAGALTRNIGNAMSRAGSTPWRNAVAGAEREIERGATEGPVFEYHAGRAVNALNNHGRGYGAGASDIMRDHGWPAIAGGFVGGELSALPHQHNRTNALPGSKARTEAETALSKDKIFDTLWPGVAMGVAGGLTGSHVVPSVLPGVRPVADSQSLADMMRRRGLQDTGNRSSGPPTGPQSPPGPAAVGPQSPPVPVPNNPAPRLVDRMAASRLAAGEPQYQLPAPGASPNPLGASGPLTLSGMLRREPQRGQLPAQPASRTLPQPQPRVSRPVVGRDGQTRYHDEHGDFTRKPDPTD